MSETKQEAKPIYPDGALRDGTKLVSVKFKVPSGGYNSGEVAGFAPAVAAKLVERQLAAYEPGPTVAPPAAPAKA